jgi:hypothetical protein
VSSSKPADAHCGAIRPRRGDDAEELGRTIVPQTYSQIASQWASRDPQAAGEWLNKQPAGPRTRPGAQSLRLHHRPSAIPRGLRVGEGDHRRQFARVAYGSIYSRLLQKGPNAPTPPSTPPLPAISPQKSARTPSRRRARRCISRPRVPRADYISAREQRARGPARCRSFRRASARSPRRAFPPRLATARACVRPRTPW